MIKSSCQWSAGRSAICRRAWRHYLLNTDTNPSVIGASDVKEPLTVANITNFLILVQMLVEEGFNLFLIDLAHLLWRHNNLVSVPIAAVRSQLVDPIQIRDLVVKDTKLLQIFDGNLLARVMCQALVTLWCR